MVVKFEITMTNKWLYSLIAVGIFLALGVGVWAYNSDMMVGNPPVMGHSAGEINVENSTGEIVSLQEEIVSLQEEIVSLQDVLDGGVDYIVNKYVTWHDSGEIWTSCAREVNKNKPAGYNICVLSNAEAPSFNLDCSRICFK
jgi:hypothetical protein